MSERTVSQIMSQGYSLCQFRIQSHELGNRVTDRCHMVHVLHTGTNVVVLGSEKNLGLVFQAAV